MDTPNSPRSGGLDHDFVDSPPDDLTCSICLLVLNEPQLTSCCGNHFCGMCVKQILAEGRPCPLCNAQNFSTMLDKYFVRKVNELKVACPQKGSGCSWSGALADLERHLDPKGGDCNFMIVECSYWCGAHLHHNELAQHLKLDCPRRPYVCKFCGYKGVYQEMSTKHWKVCEKYPLACPNTCGEVEIERRAMNHHLEKCPLQKIKCEFAYAGCLVQAQREEMPQHLKEHIQNHLAMVSRKCLHLCQQFPSEFYQTLEERLQEKDKQLWDLTITLQTRESEIEQLRERVDALREEVDELKTDTIQLKSTVFVPPFSFVMTNFYKHKEEEEQWIGPPFYSHIGGYRMCISIDANGSDDGQGSHVSIYVNLMKGEFDNHLRWPFRGNITIQLLNQRRSEGHFAETVMFTHDTTQEVAGRVEHGEVAESGLGIPKFIPHSQLSYNATKNIQYLQNSCLRFHVSKVEVSK